MAKAKGNRQSRRRGGGRKPKKAPADPFVQSKIYVNEAASHVKNGNYNRALNCYNSAKRVLAPPSTSTPRFLLCSVTQFLSVLSIMIGDVTTVFTSTSAAKSIISANRDTEYIQSFTRVDDEKSDDEKQSKKKSEGKGRRGRKDKKDDDKEEEKDGRPSSPKAQSKSTFAQISKELKARRLAQMAAAAKAKKSRKNKRRQEEIYTDKDRAAAVNLGTRDIKQSLKLKKKQDRNYFQIPEEAEPGTLLALGNNELRSGDVKIALKFVDKALELNPGDKNSLVARSKCYLLLGEPSLALQDAETALQSDKTFIRAIHQKAEALYHLGDFEHSLMYYHRGHRLRPELEIFRLGVQKAQEAIENTIGCVPGLGGPQKSVPVPKMWQSSRSEKSSVIEKSNTKSNSSIRSGKSNYDRRRSKSAASAIRRESKSLLGELGTDRIYLENLLKNPDIMCSNQEATNIIISQAEEGIAFLKSRQEFWRQQRPKTSHVPKNQSEISKKGSQNERHAELA